jgi:3',5'-cyclic AMP phosphodiesterase CpdA
MGLDPTSTTSTPRIRILHLSDLHLRGSREKEHWRRRRVLGEAWERNLDTVLADGPVDLVCFTGDVADQGLSEEYDQATEFFERLLEQLQLQRDRLFVVPGNHDIARATEREAWRALRDAIGRGADLHAISRWMAGLATEPPSGVEATWGVRTLAREENYHRWVREGLQRPELDPARSPHGNLGYRATLTILPGGVPVHVLGLDTAWLAGDDSDAGRLLLTEDQFMTLATARGAPLDGLRLVLMHHPFHDLADADRMQTLFAGHADLVLRGHLHQSCMRTSTDLDRRLSEFATGCLYEGHCADPLPIACQVLTLYGKSGEPALAGTNRFRAWSPKDGQWSDDGSLYRGSRAGRLDWSLAKPPEPPAGQVRAARPILPQRLVVNPYDPWTPIVPPGFVGRATLRKELWDALEQRRSVSLVGDWRTGKSSLFKTWEQQARASGRLVKWVSGDEASGQTPAALVESITGVAPPEDAGGAADALEAWVQGTRPHKYPPLLLVDEAESILLRFDRRFFEAVAGMLRRSAAILALSSSKDISAIYEGLQRPSPFSDVLDTHWIGLLEPEAAAEIVRWGEGVLQREDQDRMHRWAGRHPFYLQLLGTRLFKMRERGENAHNVIERFQDEAAARLRDVWRTLDDQERQALRDCVKGGIAPRHRSLRRRGLVTESGRPFGQVLSDWIREET